ncbi:g2680 [Coccomyxa elongata]
MECVGAINQGTQSTRFLIYDRTARLIASHQVEFTQITPRPGWVEHDPLEIWQSVLVCLEKAVKAAKTRVGDIKVVAVGITNQRETTIVWDRTTGKPLHNTMCGWTSGRPAFASALQRMWGPRITTGLRLGCPSAHTFPPSSEPGCTRTWHKKAPYQSELHR